MSAPTRASIFDDVCDVTEACGCSINESDRVVQSPGWPKDGMAHVACPKCGPRVAALMDFVFGAHVAIIDAPSGGGSGETDQ